MLQCILEQAFTLLLHRSDACKLDFELSESGVSRRLSVPQAGRSLSSELNVAATLLQVFSTSHKLSDINDSYWDFRVEAVPDEELNASATSRVIHVYHIAPQSVAVRC